MNPVRRLAAAVLPEALQLELKRLKYAWQLHTDAFKSDEPEFAVLDQYVRPGDWVIDVGANVGHYTKRLSGLVGPSGRVLAFEPMPTTFSILAGNVQRFSHSNVSLFNAAASDATAIVAMELPRYTDGINNYYQAHITAADNGMHVIAYPLDQFLCESRIALVKIDAEGHEESVIAGMRALIERDKPTLIVETGKETVVGDLRMRGYQARSFPHSPNLLFTFTPSS